MLTLTRLEAKEIDRQATEIYGLPSIVLMENAGRNAASLLESLQVAGPIVIVCGKGNNAGDGFVMARHLSNRSHDVRVLLAVDPSEYQGDAATNLTVIERSGVPVICIATSPRETLIRELSQAAWIVDALLGTGASGEVRPPFAAIIEIINSLGCKVFSVDVPSGLDCNTGKPLGTCIRATVTGTFVAKKLGFSEPGASFWTGRVHLLDIGAPRVIFRVVKGLSSPMLEKY